MATQYTSILKLALPVTGELSGTWGDVVNDNITSMVEQAIAGLATINSWTANAHTLTVADGTTSESRCAMLVADDDGAGNPSAAAEIICPAATKLYVLKNISGQQVTLKTSGGTGVAVPNNETAFLFCDGTNVNACITSIVNGRVTGNLVVDGNTTLGDSASDTVTFNADIASTILPSADNTYDIGSSGASWKDLYIDGTAYLALVDINGGAIDGVTLGTNSAVTEAQIDNVNINGNTISTTDTNGDLTLAPDGTGNLNVNADTLRVGDQDVNATITTNGTGDLTINTNAGTNSGSITIEDGVNGNIDITPDGTGEVNISKVDIAAGEIDGTAIGANSASTGKFTAVTDTALTSGRVTYATTGGELTDSANLAFDGTTLTAAGFSTSGTAALATVNATTVDTTNIEVTNIKAKDGTAAGSIADATGVVTLASSVLTTTDINGGSIDAVTLGTNSPVTEAQIDNVNINGNTISSTDTDGDLNLTPNGAGNLVLDGLNWPQADGTANYVLQTNGSGQLSWAEQSGGGGIVYVRKTANYTASADEGIIADTSGGSWTLTLPSAPSVGDVVVVADGAAWGTNNLTIARNGSTIEGAAEDLTCDVSGVSITLVYDGTTWHVYVQAGITSTGGISTGKAIAMAIVFG